MDLPEPSEYVTRCPYEGVHRSVRVGDKLVKNIAWSYPAPIPVCSKIENPLSSYTSHVDLYVDGVLQDRPTRSFSSRQDHIHENLGREAIPEAFLSPAIRKFP